MLYLLDQGFSILQANFVSSIFNIAQIVMEIPSGAISDIAGERKTAFYSGLSLIIAMLLFLMGTNTFCILLAQIFWGISYALVSGSLESWVVKKTQYRDKELDHLFAVNAKIKNMVMIFGSFLGAYFAGVSLNYIWILPLFSAISFLVLADQFMKFDKLPEVHMPQSMVAIIINCIRETGKKIKDGFHTVKCEKNIQIIYGLNLLIAIVFSPMLLFWSLYLNHLRDGQDYWFLAWMWLLIKLANILGNSILQYLIHKKKRFTILAVSVFLISVVSLAFGITCNIWIVAFLILILECSYGVVVPIQRAIVNDNINDNQRATLISFGVVFTAAGKFLSGILYGLLAEALTITFTWIFGGVVSILLLLFIRNKYFIINGVKCN